MARGGSRQGKPGAAYANRKDLQAPKAPTGMPYGAHKAEIDAQRAVPLAAAPSLPAPGNPPAGAGGGAALGDFTRPTDRPTEPITAGLPMGAGPGPEALSTVGPQADAIGGQLRALYAANPNNDILRLIELHDNGY